MEPPMTKVQFPSIDAAASVMGALYAAGKVRTWNHSRTAKGCTVRFLDGRVWRDLTQFDLDRLIGIASGAKH